LPFIFGEVTQPNLILVFVVLIALHMGQKMGITTALIGGFCQDVIIGNFFGVHLLPYLIIAFVCGAIGENIDRDQWFLTLLIVVVATEATLLLTFGLLWMAGQYVRFLPYILQYSIPMLVYHAIIALPIDRVVWHLRRDDGYSFLQYR
jgi:rod shape-determining protein MreD